jgi:hypothetical protein
MAVQGTVDPVKDIPGIKAEKAIIHEIVGDPCPFIVQGIGVEGISGPDKGFGGIPVNIGSKMSIGDGIGELPDFVGLIGFHMVVYPGLFLFECCGILDLCLKIPLVCKVHSHLFGRNGGQGGIKEYRFGPRSGSQPFFKLRVFSLHPPVVEGYVGPEKAKKLLVRDLLNICAKIVGRDLMLISFNLVFDKQVLVFF